MLFEVYTPAYFACYILLWSVASLFRQLCLAGVISVSFLCVICLSFCVICLFTLFVFVCVVLVQHFFRFVAVTKELSLYSFRLRN